jgi:hypothetical protein
VILQTAMRFLPANDNAFLQRAAVELADFQRRTFKALADTRELAAATRRLVSDCQALLHEADVIATNMRPEKPGSSARMIGGR